MKAPLYQYYFVWRYEAVIKGLSTVVTIEY
jgi:hypothetical protein